MSTRNRHRPSTTGRTVAVVGDNDIQLGRGRPIVTSEGNKRFRQLVLSNRAVYTSSGKHAHKDTIARQILATIQERGGSFLRKLESPTERAALGLPMDAPAWVVVDEDTSLLKVKQALREQESSKSESKSTTPPRKRRKNEASAPENEPNDAPEAESVARPNNSAASLPVEALGTTDRTARPGQPKTEGEEDEDNEDEYTIGDSATETTSASPPDEAPKKAMELLMQLKHSTLAADDRAWDDDGGGTALPPPDTHALSQSRVAAVRDMPSQADPTSPEAALLSHSPMKARSGDQSTTPSPPSASSADSDPDGTRPMAPALDDTSRDAAASVPDATRQDAASKHPTTEGSN